LCLTETIKFIIDFQFYNTTGYPLQKKEKLDSLRNKDTGKINSEFINPESAGCVFTIQS
jgi:hypothetical protein